jgi:hypothetical protein
MISTAVSLNMPNGGGRDLRKQKRENGAPAGSRLCAVVVVA